MKAGEIAEDEENEVGCRKKRMRRKRGGECMKEDRRGRRQGGRG